MGLFARFLGGAPPPLSPALSGPAPVLLPGDELEARLHLGPLPAGWSRAVGTSYAASDYVGYGPDGDSEVEIGEVTLELPRGAYPGWEDDGLHASIAQGLFDLDRLADASLAEEPDAALVERTPDRVLLRRVGSDGPYLCVFARRRLGPHAFYLWLDGHRMRLRSSSEGLEGVVLRDEHVREALRLFETFTLAPPRPRVPVLGGADLALRAALDLRPGWTYDVGESWTNDPARFGGLGLPPRDARFGLIRLLPPLAGYPRWEDEAERAFLVEQGWHDDEAFVPGQACASGETFDPFRHATPGAEVVERGPDYVLLRDVVREGAPLRLRARRRVGPYAFTLDVDGLLVQHRLYDPEAPDTPSAPTPTRPLAEADVREALRLFQTFALAPAAPPPL